MKIKLGIAPIAWSNDDMPELGGDTPIETCLSEAKQSGYTGIELGGKFPRNDGIIKYLLNKYNLKFTRWLVWFFIKFTSVDSEWEKMQDQINLLKKINADVFVFADVSDSVQGKFRYYLLRQRPKLEG